MSSTSGSAAAKVYDTAACSINIRCDMISIRQQSFALAHTIRKWRQITMKAKRLGNSETFLIEACRQQILRAAIRRWIAARQTNQQQRLHGVSVWRRFVLKHRTYRQAGSWHSMSILLSSWKKW